MFHGEHGIALHTMQGNRASSLGKGGVTWFFSSCGGNLGYILELRRGLGLQNSCFSAMSGLLSNCEGQLRIHFKPWPGNRDASQGEAGDPGPFPVATVVFGFLAIFKRSHISSPLETLNSEYLSRSQKDVSLPVEMRRRTRSFSMVSTGDSDIASFYEMKDEPGFKPLQGYPAFFQGTAFRCPFHLTQQIQGCSHIPVAERSLLLRSLWKVGIPLESNPGNSHLKMIWGTRSFPRVAVLNLVFL